MTSWEGKKLIALFWKEFNTAWLHPLNVITWQSLKNGPKASFKMPLDHSKFYVPCVGMCINLSPCCNGTERNRILMSLAHTRVSGSSWRWHAVVRFPHCADKNRNMEGWNSAEIGTPELIESEGNLQELAVKSVWSLSCWAEIRVRGQCVRYLDSQSAGLFK